MEQETRKKLQEWIGWAVWSIVGFVILWLAMDKLADDPLPFWALVLAWVVGMVAYRFILKPGFLYLRGLIFGGGE